MRKAIPARTSTPRENKKKEDKNVGKRWKIETEAKFLTRPLVCVCVCIRVMLGKRVRGFELKANNNTPGTSAFSQQPCEISGWCASPVKASESDKQERQRGKSTKNKRFLKLVQSKYKQIFMDFVDSNAKIVFWKKSSKDGYVKGILKKSSKWKPWCTNVKFYPKTQKNDYSIKSNIRNIFKFHGDWHCLVEMEDDAGFADAFRWKSTKINPMWWERSGWRSVANWCN